MRQIIEQQVFSFIIENFLYGQNDDDLQPSDSLLERRIIDSTGVLELVAFVEETYGINVNDEELVPENLDSVENITRYLLRKLPQTHPQPSAPKHEKTLELLEDAACVA